MLGLGEKSGERRGFVLKVGGERIGFGMGSNLNPWGGNGGRARPGVLGDTKGDGDIFTGGAVAS